MARKKKWAFPKMKSIPEDALELNVTKDKKVILLNKDDSGKKKYEVKSGVILWQLIFCFDKIKKDHKISIKDMLLLLYLKDLYIFPLKVVVFDNNYDVSKLIREALVEKEDSYKKNRYKLSDVGLELVDTFMSLVKNKGSFVKGYARIYDTDVDTKVDSLLDEFFN